MEEQMSECRSFGSNCHPWSQSRKISIGVVVDSSAKTRSKTVGKDEGTIKLNSRQAISSADGHKGGGVTAATTGKQIGAPEKETSPWVWTRPFNQTIPTLENGTVGFFANQMSDSQAGDENQNRFTQVTHERNGGKDSTAERVNEFSFATAKEVFAPEKGVVEDKTNKTETRGSETLRMKLWEILGTVSSPNKQLSGSQDFEKGASNLRPEQRSYEHGDPVGKPRQNSDTIESDSENPDHTARRPVTRTFTRKRAPTKVQPKKTASMPLSSNKPKVSKNIFKEGRSVRRHHAVNNGSSMSKTKKSEQIGFGTVPRRMSSPAHENVDEIQQSNSKSKITNPSEKLQLFGNRTGSFRSFLPKKTGESIRPKNGIQEHDPHRSPVMKIIVQPLQENADQQEDFANASFSNILDPQQNLQSPTFDRETPINRYSANPVPKVNHGELEDHIHPDSIHNMEGILSFKGFLASKPENHRTSAQMESSEDAGEHADARNTKSVPIMEEKDTEDGLSKSSSEESESESSQEYSSLQGRCAGLKRNRECLFPEIGVVQKSKFVLHPTKRLGSQEFSKLTGLSPTSDSPKGTESFGFQGPSEQNQEDGLASVVALFALALERVKSKMELLTSQKSAAILMSVAEGIHLQLQNAESRIQTDLKSLTSLSKSKRKCLETRFEEQQKQLKAIHERFKEEVGQHIQDCINTVEGLEPQQIEFKGAVEKQKASHKKLILQAEEAIEIQLNDAQRNMTAVHKSAREKMLQLKCVIAECLKEDILS